LKSRLHVVVLDRYAAGRIERVHRDRCLDSRTNLCIADREVGRGAWTPHWRHNRRCRAVSRPRSRPGL